MGVSLAGSYTDRRAAGLHDDLYARAFLVDDGTRQIAVVSCDLIGLRAETVAGARRLVEESCGIPGDHVLLAATHNHSGPVTRDLATGGLAGEPDEPYLALLERQIAAAVQGAARRRAPARLRLSLGHAEGIAFNRRFVMRQGPVRTNPGKGNPDVLHPAGPVDDRVWTLTALPAGEGGPAGGAGGAGGVPPNVVPLGLLVSFGLHPAIVAGTVVGGDFPAFLEGAVQRLLSPAGPAGGEPVVVFANAPCGDINHVDLSHAQPQTGFPEAARVGTILAAAAVQGACRLTPEWDLEGAGRRGGGGSIQLAGPPAAGATARLDGAGVRGARRVVELPLRRPTAAEVAWARGAAQGRMTMVPGAGLEVVEAHRILSLAEGWTGETRATEVQALALGDDLALVGLPGEIFAQLGLELRQRSPFRHTLVLGLANEAIGYVPTRAAYDEGGYEPAASRLRPGGGEALVAAALDLLASLR